ncbi:hypothetical protein L1987_17063 [Smallanthus sonchifolius]|uniref:Uncharacterized protein n=1 Tax=Smallanthus sonchifolius TaxID=185202 RepID=A0ACB9IY25_9ASTR|nr:hypothetical protein L1987_17063 [Smallanthus sonchifolius]
MSSINLDEHRCSTIVSRLFDVFVHGQELRRDFSREDIYQFYGYCFMLYNKKVTDRYSEPMVWIGVYIAIASFFCILAMVADLFLGFRNKKFWFPCKYFSLNAASITVIAVAMKLPVDLNSEMGGYMDQAAKLGSLAFMGTMMANLMPSLASMDNKTLLANIIGLCILIITMIVNICIQINTGVIGGFGFPIVACFYTAMIILLLIMMISSSLTIPTCKVILESKYQATNKIYLADQRPQSIQMSTIEKLRHRVRRYWVMAETGSPQFVMASNPLSTASGVICVVVLVINLLMGYIFLFRIDDIKRQLRYDFKNVGASPYKWSTAIILITQSTGVVVGTIAPVCRCFSVFSFKLDTKWNRNYFMFFKVEVYWIEKLHEWKQSPVLFLLRSRRSRNLIYNSKNIILSLCIGFQKVIVVSCKVIRLVASIFVVSCYFCWTLLKAIFTLPITLRTDDIDEDLSSYVLQIDNEMELSERILKRISNSMNYFILKVEKEENNYHLELLEKSTDFKGVEIFDTDQVQPLFPAKLVNTWSLPIITLTCIALALPNIPMDAIEKLFKSVDEGLSYTHLVEENLNSASEYVNIRKTTQILWHEVEHKCKWLDNPLAKNVFKGKTATEIVEWFSREAKEVVGKIKGSTDGELAENPPHTLIAANSMYRITQTILLRYQSNIEPITKKQLFAHLSGMIADIFSACFTNIPRVITMKCHERVIEKREASVRVAAKLLGKSTKIIERVEILELPSMDEDKMAYIDEWHLYLKQSIP